MIRRKELEALVGEIGARQVKTDRDLDTARDRLREAEKTIDALVDRCQGYDEELDKFKGQMGSMTPVGAVPGIHRRVNDLANAHSDLAQVVEDLGKTRAPRPRAELDEDERRDLKNTWAYMVCASCGHLHSGACPRVRRQRVEHEFAGQALTHETITTVYWPNDAWEPPQGALSMEDVFGSAVEAARQVEKERSDVAEPEAKV